MYDDFTPTERKLLAVLDDGMSHTKRELHACLSDDLGDLSNLKFHIANLRRKLRPRGRGIVCELARHRVICYRQVILIAPSDD